MVGKDKAKKGTKEGNVIITAALPYANAFLHLGHIASTYLPADIFARFMKIKYKGKGKVKFVSASDEHGTPIEISAKRFNIKPEEYIKIFRKEHLKDLKAVEIEFDKFHGTHSKENEELVKLFFEKAKEKGLIYSKEIEALYCPKCNMFLPDRYVKGTCPYCGAPDQYGDVCEKCGKTYHATDLKDPKCAICGSTPTVKRTEHLFFKLSALQDKVEEYLKSNKNLQEDAKNYALSWIKKGLRDLDITRDAPYFGFPIPEHEGKYFYVWIDAPLGYIASYIAEGNKLEEWNKAEIHHFIGKDIIYFHYIYWIAMLITTDLQLPKNIPTRGYLTLNKNKMSKSRGNFIYLRDLHTSIPSTFIRYYFARNIPDHISDGDFSWEELIEKGNKELMGNIVNLIYRVTSFLYNQYPSKPLNISSLSPQGEEFLTKIEKKLQQARIKEALDTILEFSSFLNSRFNDLEPWKRVKEEREEVFKELIELFKDVLALAMSLEPYLPSLISKFYSFFSFRRKGWKEFCKVGRIEKVEHLLEKLNEEYVTFVRGDNDFSKLDLRVGEIREVNEHENADKLYVIKLWDGKRERQLVGGLREHYAKEELVGRKVVFVSNLKPAKLRGEVSEGMLLAASKNGVVGVLYVDDPKILPGDDVIIKGVIKKPLKEVSIEQVRRVRMFSNAKGNVVWEGKEIIARSICHEEKVKVDRFEKIGEGGEVY